jgi:hypothetical protein
VVDVAHRGQEQEQLVQLGFELRPLERLQDPLLAIYDQVPAFVLLILLLCLLLVLLVLLRCRVVGATVALLLVIRTTPLQRVSLHLHRLPQQ